MAWKGDGGRAEVETKVWLWADQEVIHEAWAHVREVLGRQRPKCVRVLAWGRRKLMIYYSVGSLDKSMYMLMWKIMNLAFCSSWIMGIYTVHSLFMQLLMFCERSVRFHPPESSLSKAETEVNIFWRLVSQARSETCWSYHSSLTLKHEGERPKFYVSSSFHCLPLMQGDFFSHEIFWGTY